MQRPNLSLSAADVTLWQSRRYLWLVCTLLSVGCGARTGFETDLASVPVQGSAGAAAAPCTKDWDQIVWDASREEAVLYLWTVNANDTWAVVAGDAVGVRPFHRDHWDGSSWTRTASENDPSGVFGNQQIWAADGGQAFAGGTQDLQRWTGKIWANWQNTPGCHAIAGTATNDLWCATDSELWRFDGANWTQSLSINGVQGILAKTRNDVWIWGTSGASHFDGIHFQPVLSDPVKRVSTSTPNDIWVVQDGNVLHATSPSGPWTLQNPTGGIIASVWSESPSNTWVVAAGAGMRWNGQSWQLMDLPMQDERLLISGSADDIWIAGTLKLAHGHPVCR
ncbi:MAG TPA: hypothetical protein VER96_05270 [Polyangiaceae bacterium]|nr:hypothetical protein [Polyangiaceae bacterium]